MKRLILASAFLLCLGAAAAPLPYQLDGTEVRDIHSASLKRDYQLLVALPESYGSSQRRYPVLFVTDANYAFPLARAIASRLAKHAGMEEVIVVGLSYARGDTPGYSRRRDYTPSTPRSQTYVSDMPGRALAFGEAGAYGRFIAGEVFPLIAAQYRADMRRKAFVGHSYGSLLGLEILLTEPATFEHYILGSPRCGSTAACCSSASRPTPRQGATCRLRCISASAGARRWRRASAARVRKKRPTWWPT